MNQDVDPSKDPDLLDEYDFTAGVRGKYAPSLTGSSTFIVLDPDVADVFPTSEAVNEALRLLARLARQQADRWPA